MSFSTENPDTSLEVLATDYDTFAVVHSCFTYFFGTIKSEHLWLLTRKPLRHNKDEDAQEIDLMTQLVKAEVAKNMPDFDFDKHMHKTYQGINCAN